MKRNAMYCVKSILALLLVLSMLLSVCSCAGSKDDQDSQTNNSETSNENVETTEGNQASDKVTVTESYLGEKVCEKLEGYMDTKPNFFGKLEKVDKLDTDDKEKLAAPYVLTDLEAFSSSKLKSITIPIHSTLSVDSNGDFKFSISVFKTDITALKNSSREIHKIKINAEKYGLEENATNVNRLIKVDLSGYNINLSKNETIGFCASTDTVIPLYIKTDLSDGKNLPAIAISNHRDSAQCFFGDVGKSSIQMLHNFLFFDVEYERTYNKADILAAEKRAAEFENIMDAVKEKYKGKSISILGDSISTFYNVSNHTKYNATIGNNYYYYHPGRNPFRSENTYWGRLIEDLDMTLCVNNSWSGSMVYGQKAWSYSDNATKRATELHNRQGQNPDVIVFYMGINDLAANIPFGDLCNKLKATSKDKYDQVIEEWFNSVLSATSNATNCVANTTYKSFEQAYALALYKMTQKYSSAEVWCVGLIKDTRTAVTNDKINNFNLCISALADYFGANYISQDSNEIKQHNSLAYSMDMDSLHPNAAGHRLLERLIINEWYKKIK